MKLRNTKPASSAILFAISIGLAACGDGGSNRDAAATQAGAAAAPATESTVSQSAQTASTTAACPTPGRQPATEALIALVEDDASLKASLNESISLGQRINNDPATNPVATLDDYYDFIDALVTYNPQNIDTINRRPDTLGVVMDGENYCNWNILDLLAYSYFLVDRQLTTDPRGQIQFENAAFSNWMRDVSSAWGAYLETPASAIYVPDFEGDPNFGNWYCPEAPYETFQSFFVRELCRATFPNGSRPVEGYDDPLTVVSIGDSQSMGWWAISEDEKLVTGYDRMAQSGRAIKGKLYSDVREFVNGGDGETVLASFGEDLPAGTFANGVFTHQFLNVNNYHRLHVPVAGKLVFMRHFQGGSRMKSQWSPPIGDQNFGFYDPLDTPDWQFGQTRVVLGIETPEHGVVIAAPMGMAQVDGIDLREWVQDGAYADKGWEFSNFKFGGSDFVVIFEEQAQFVLTVAEDQNSEQPPYAGVNYLPSIQGQKYGCLGGSPDCSAVPGAPPPYPGYDAPSDR